MCLNQVEKKLASDFKKVSFRPLASWSNFKYLVILGNFLSRAFFEFLFQILMESSTFQKCTLYLRNDDPIELAKVFLPKYLGGNEHSIKYLTRFTIHCELLHRVSHFDRSQWKFSISNE